MYWLWRWQNGVRIKLVGTTKINIDWCYCYYYVVVVSFYCRLWVFGMLFRLLNNEGIFSDYNELPLKVEQLQRPIMDFKMSNSRYFWSDFMRATKKWETKDKINAAFPPKRFQHKSTGSSFIKTINYLDAHIWLWNWCFETPKKTFDGIVFMCVEHNQK